MLSLIPLLVLQTPFATGDKLWEAVEKAYGEYKTYSYSVQVVGVDQKGKYVVHESGNASFQRKGDIYFSYRDNDVGVNASMSRDAKGNWDQGASDDANSSSPANNALGYCDGIPSKWSYAPVALLLGEYDLSKGWNEGAPREVEFRKIPCYLLEGKSGPGMMKIWVEKSRLTLFRVEERDEKNRLRITAFDKTSGT